MLAFQCDIKKRYIPVVVSYSHFGAGGQEKVLFSPLHVFADLTYRCHYWKKLVLAGPVFFHLIQASWQF